ncbi:hypothetical protein SUGI_0765600 [Cryptomeria japonica]|nr:hypothetical protein SUGI_0765600 [Cryptomeria japonica]
MLQRNRSTSTFTKNMYDRMEFLLTQMSDKMSKLQRQNMNMDGIIQLIAQTFGIVNCLALRIPEQHLKLISQ